jgi:murein DD-endopeptidase MepM/ murein hydrolase activator NlpD
MNRILEMPLESSAPPLVRGGEREKYWDQVRSGKTALSLDTWTGRVPHLVDRGTVTPRRIFGRRTGRLANRIHAAMDLPGPRGATVHAPIAGQVLFSGRKAGYGNLVLLHHPNPPRTAIAGAGALITVYAHLDRRSVSQGDSVAAGTVIGQMGNTTQSESGSRAGVREGMGVHLHFSVQSLQADRSRARYRDAQGEPQSTPVPDTTPDRIPVVFSSHWEEDWTRQIRPDTWLEQIGVQPVGTTPPAAAHALSETRDEYTGRAYTPSRDASVFRCAPDPVAVSPATLLPTPSTTAEADVRAALTSAGLPAAQWAAFQAGGGVTALAPIAGAFGAAALGELIARLRYTPAQLANPPHTYGGDAALTRALGVRRPALLAVRLLTAIPGHFRQLARRAPNEAEAFALENLGWLVMRSLADRVASATSKRFWVPPAPQWVTYWPDTMPSYSAKLQRLILRWLLVDTTLALGDFRAREQAWRQSLAGRQWKLETGVESSAAGPGRPFYAQLVNLPAAVNLAAERSRIDAAWRRRLSDTDSRHTPLSEASTRALTQPDDALLSALGLAANASLGGLEFSYHFPVLTATARRSSLKMLAAVAPAFTSLCETIYALGWQDLLFNTAGSFVFRGIRQPNNPSDPQRRHRAARRISDHGYGIAVDLHAFENPQGSAHSTHDPRIVAVFEAFRFRWGKCFPTPDPHHFEYAG